MGETCQAAHEPSASGGDNGVMDRLGIVWWGTLTLCAVLLVYNVWATETDYTISVPNVVACVGSPNPATKVEVTSNRAGTIDARNILGCTVYWYEGPHG